ncbi:hypothetical protein A11A3_00560 [Alcanivorax hongdengensis A-11-3]|uniref:DUF11 domain-containing protein n=1 Tax=Alcanivorax hongdengensis A-11-3 TaxID=1177179 RepID=L0WJE1_9GAMM|nr:DUF11 domain-containing protein [Alcanivorax hongdengensis]EKF75940.1 hypothetical protein A11A3_00560 [Alcanivorax hongdengensis A-11-3]
MKHAFNRGMLSSKLAASLVTGSLLFAAGQTWALTAAGTDIKNKATVTYEDINGNSYSAQSNEAVVTVETVYAGSLLNDGNKSGAPGQTVYFSHTLENTGNSTDTFTLDGDGNSVYVDTNSNGVPDAGETAATSVQVTAGSTVHLILAVPVSSGATAGSTINGNLYVHSSGGNGLVTDNGTNGDAGSYDSDGVNGADGNDSNNDTVTVTTDAVLDVTKQATVSGNTITYTLTVKNNGGRAATGVDIYDGIPAGATFDSVVSVNGLLGSNSDTYQDASGTDQSLPHGYSGTAALAHLDETALGVDLNGDGDTSDADVSGMLFTDQSLGVNTTVSIVYKVTMNAGLNAGTQIKNTAYADGDLDGDSNQDGPSSSNTVITTVGQTYAVTADDTEVGADTTDDDVYTVASAASGAVVEFKHTITNNGNGDDAFELSIDNSGGSAFPSGTTFSYWNASGTVQVTDTNGDGNPDTGNLALGASVNITVKANLPAGISGSAGYDYTLTATSVGNTAISDDTAGHLDAISSPAVDLANSDTAITTANDDLDPYTGTYPAGTPTVTQAATSGTAVFDLYVANESGNPQSFTLSQNLPTGWSVVYTEVGVDADDDGTYENTTNAGNVVTATPSLPHNGVYHYQATVQISSVLAESSAGDHNVEFIVTSASDSNVSDSVLDAVTVPTNRNVNVTPDGTNQVQPGGNIGYSHVVANSGNTDETVELTASNSQSGWTNLTQVKLGGSCTLTAISSLTAGTGQQLCNAAGTAVTVDIAIGTNGPQVTLNPGESFSVNVTVYAPSNAAQGDVDTLTLSATNTDSGAPAAASGSATDITNVITSQVRLDKSAAVQVADGSGNCGCESGTWPASGDFMAVQTTKVKPGSCVVWRLEATNESSVSAQNVTISDETTPYTSLLAADKACKDSDDGANCTPTTGTAAVAPTASPLSWNVGSLASGDTARAQFCVRVN